MSKTEKLRLKLENQTPRRPKRQSYGKILLLLGVAFFCGMKADDCSGDSGRGPKDKSGEVLKKPQKTGFIPNHERPGLFSENEGGGLKDEDELICMPNEEMELLRDELLANQEFVKFLKEKLKEREGDNATEDEESDEEYDKKVKQAQEVFKNFNPNDLENGIHGLTVTDSEMGLTPEELDDIRKTLRDFTDKLNNYKFNPDASNRCNLEFAFDQVRELTDGLSIGNDPAVLVHLKT